MTVKAAVFDMFETLITQYQSPPCFGREIAEGLGLSEETFRELWNDEAVEAARFTGRLTLEALLERILRQNGRFSQGALDAVVEKRLAAKRECLNHLHPEILPLLSKLKESGLLLGLVSNCYSEETPILRSSELFPFFDAACLSWEEGVQKPDPAIFQRCLERLDVPADACVYVGDGGSQELEAAAALGMRPIQAVWYLRREPIPGAVQASSPLELLRHL